MEQLSAVAQVPKRTAYQHFPTKDELVAECLRQFDPDLMPGVFDSADLTPRERLLAAFGMAATSPLCPYIAAAVELHDPQHPASQYARDCKTAIAARLTETARAAGATDPEQLGEQLALLLDGASARTQVLNSEASSTAAAIAAVLIDNAIPEPSSGSSAETVNRRSAPGQVEARDDSIEPCRLTGDIELVRSEGTPPVLTFVHRVSERAPSIGHWRRKDASNPECRLAPPEP